MKDICELQVIDKKIVIVSNCNHCNANKVIEIPKEEIEFLKSCGLTDIEIPRIYKDYKLSNCYFSCFVKFKCDLCGVERVLAWESGNSPAAHEIIHPSEELRFWPNYNYPTHSVKICKWCMPDNDDEKSRKEFMIKLINAMLKEEKGNWACRIKHKNQWGEINGQKNNKDKN